MKITFKRVVAIVAMGAVGYSIVSPHIAFRLAMRGVDKIQICDREQGQRLASEYLKHADSEGASEEFSWDTFYLKSVIAETTNAAHAKDIASRLSLIGVAGLMPYSCKCEGKYVIYFYRNGVRGSMIGYEEPRLKFIPHTMWDMLITRESIKILNEWIRNGKAPTMQSTVVSTRGTPAAYAPGAPGFRPGHC